MLAQRGGATGWRGEPYSFLQRERDRTDTNRAIITLPNLPDALQGRQTVCSSRGRASAES
jgi:hypothetical protein